jgi:hypothetical protein
MNMHIAAGCAAERRVNAERNGKDTQITHHRQTAFHFHFSSKHNFSRSGERRDTRNLIIIAFERVYMVMLEVGYYQTLLN